MVYLILGYLLWCGAFYFSQRKILFPVDLTPRPTPPPANVEVIRLATAAGEVEAWFAPAPGASSERPAPLVIYFHGNGELISEQERMVDGYHDLGFSVLLPEYRGYGNSAGKPSQAAIAEDATAFYDLIVKRPEVDGARIVYHGRSLGGGVAAQLASQRKPKAMVLESTFASVTGMALRYGIPPFIVTNPFRTDLVLRGLDVPVLILHGTRDTVIPVRNGRALAGIAGERGKYVEYPCGHNDFPGFDREEDYWREIEARLIGAAAEN